MSKVLQNKFGSLYLFTAVFIAIAMITRTALLIKTFSMIDKGFIVLMKTYSIGLFYDLVTAFYASIPLILYLIIVPGPVYNNRIHKYIGYCFAFLTIYALIFGSVGEWLFWDEFGVRYNFIAVDYIVYTQEVFDNIVESYPVPMIMVVIGFVSLLIFRLMFFKDILPNIFQDHTIFKKRVIQGTTFLFLPIAAFIWVDHSFSEISANRYNNELSKNGIYSLFSAFINNVMDYDALYVQKDNEAVFKNLRKLIHTSNSKFSNPYGSSIDRFISNTGEEKKYNVIQITVESLSSKYLGIFGNQDGLTPFMDSIAEQGILFTNFHSTGTRTVRGLEALTLSVVPTPGRSIVKRPHNENMFSSGFLFQEKGYDTRFIYGGYGYFDNMNYFYEHNGFSVTDRTDLTKDEISFFNAWGVCDEDLLTRTLKEADKSYQSGKPFYSLIMTTSNHRPFTYPKGKIDIPSHTGRHGGVKYTDYAIGQFMKAAQTRAWFKDTIFVIVADHCAGSAGKTELPVKEYEIPLIIYNPGLFEPQKIDKLCSQVDFAPTLLGLMNWSYKSKFFGQDIFKMLPEDERAFIGNYQKLGLMKDDNLAILSPQKKSHIYKFSRNDGQLKPTSESNGNMLLDVVSYYQAGNYLYKNRLDRRN